MTSRIKQRSKIIRMIKYGLALIVAITAIIVISYIIANQDSKISYNNAAEIEDLTKIVPDIVFQAQAPDFVGLSVDHGPYYIQAAEMQELSGHISFKSPKVKLMLKHLDWLHLSADNADLTKDDNHLQLFENVTADLNQLHYFQGSQVSVLIKESIIKSEHNVKILADLYDLNSQNGFILKYNDQIALFYGKINANIKDKTTTNITSDKFEVAWQKKTGDFLGNVILTKDGTIVKANKMTAVLNPKTHQLDKIYAYDNIKIINADQVATGEYGEYNIAKAHLVLKNNVTLTKQGNLMKGELLNYDFNSKTAALVGGANQQRVRAIITPKVITKQ